VDNKAIANVFYETADLMEINGDDSFRIRSYRRAAEALEGLPQQVSGLIGEPKKLLEIPGIGKGMAANIQELCRSGKLGPHQELLVKYRPSMLELLKIQGTGAENDRAALERLPSKRSRWSGEAGARRQAPRTAAA